MTHHRWFASVPSSLIADYEALGWLWCFPQWASVDGSYYVAKMEYICSCRRLDQPPTPKRVRVLAPDPREDPQP